VNKNLNRKIRVAHIITRIITGGAEENTLYTIKGLDKKKYDIDLIVGEEFRKDIYNNFKNNDFCIIQLKGLKGKLNFLYDPVVLIKLINLFKKNHYDIVHTHLTKIGILGKIASRISGVPIIIHGLHGSAFQAFNSKLLNWTLIFFERITSKYTDAYISVSRILSERYIKEGIGKRENHFTVYSGMNLDKFYYAREKIKRRKKLADLGISSDCFIIGNVATLEPRKGHKFLIDAFKKVIEKHKNRSIKLIIVSDGYERENLVNYVDKLDLKEKVIFTGYREDIEELMAIMDVFVLSSLREGLPRVLVQAAAVGIPLIAFNVDGVPEIIKNNYNGFLVRPKDVEELADRIIRYINNRELISLHGQRGREFVKDKWSIEDMVNKIDKIYQALIKEKIKNVKR